MHYGRGQGGWQERSKEKKGERGREEGNTRKNKGQDKTRQRLTVNGTIEAVEQLALGLGNYHCRSKVNQLDAKVIIDDNVLVLDVAMADATRVEIVDALHNLFEDHTGLRLGELGVVLDTLK